MEASILISTKKVVGLAEDYTHFDLDIITHINTAFFVLNQLGVGPPDGFVVEDETAVWEDFIVPSVDLSAVRTYIYLKVGLLFDPPQIGFLLTAKEKQIEELEYRLNVNRENSRYPAVNNPYYPPIEEMIP